MSPEEYTELLKYIHKLNNENINDIVSNYDSKTNKIWHISILIDADYYYAMTISNVGIKATNSISFWGDECNIENIKEELNRRLNNGSKI